MTGTIAAAKTMNTPLGPNPDVAAWLKSKSSLLVLSHERPDGDALGSVYGLVQALIAAGKQAVGYLQAPPPSRYRKLLADDTPILTGQQVDLSPYSLDGVVCVDTTGMDRLDAPCPVQELLNRDICNLDHHLDNHRFGNAVWIAEAAATAQMLAVQLDHLNWLTPAAATALMTGLVMDTGGFRFPNTSADALRTAALLMDAGADFDRVMDHMFFREKFARRLLEAEVLKQTSFAYDGRLAYAVLRPERVEALGLDPAELEGLIDLLRSIDGVEIACLLQPQPDCMRFSLRARSGRFPVNGIAHDIGGGGHLLAAGAKRANLTLAEAEQLLLQLAGKVFPDHESQ